MQFAVGAPVSQHLLSHGSWPSKTISDRTKRSWPQEEEHIDHATLASRWRPRHDIYGELQYCHTYIPQSWLQNYVHTGRLAQVDLGSTQQAGRMEI